jgi:hypothetical protein
MNMNVWTRLQLVSLLLVMCVSMHARVTQAQNTRAQDRAERRRSGEDAPADVLSPDEWQRVDDAVERALAWLAGEQRPDGSFPRSKWGSRE